MILALADALSSGDQAARVTILTHRFADECRVALSPTVQLVQSGRNLNLTGNHYLDSLIEYGSVPALLKYLPADASAICFFGPPSLPGLWWAKRVRRLKIPLLYFCYEPPRAAYTDRQEVSRRMGRLGLLARPLFWLYRPLDRYLTRQADRVLVNGQYGQSLIRQTYGLPSTIITHGAELSRPADLVAASRRVRERFGLDARPVILTVNHLHPRKRVDLLLRAMPSVLAEHPTVVGLIVGQGPEEIRLRKLAADLGLTDQQVIFTGFVPEADLAAFYGAADIYAHTGRAETFGLSVLEASMAGLPVVATDEGGPREIIVEGRTGFLIEANLVALAARLNQLLSQPARAQAIGRAGAELVADKYRWEHGAADFREILSDIQTTA